jgi:type II restriction/modification system DNA methylase subunit YeeA
VGDKKMRGELGDAYTEALRAAYKGRVPGGADLVCYWFERARAQLESGALLRAGLVATNSIRGGKNREVLDCICEQTRIFEAWSDEPWINNGAAVRVSLVAFGNSSQAVALDGNPLPLIRGDLSSGNNALNSAEKLPQNASASFIGAQQNGPFTVPGAIARHWLSQPTLGTNAMSAVVRPWCNGRDLTDRSTDVWLIDFGTTMAEQDAALIVEPFEHLVEHVKPMRLAGQRESRKINWWRLGEPSPALRKALRDLPRFVATPRVAKHRVWVQLPTVVLPDVQVVVIARADDTTLGLLHSRFHELWSLRLGTSLEDRPRYTPTTCFETFPFPAGLTPADTAHQRTETLPTGALIPADLPPETRPHASAIAQAAQRLVALRDAWLNPPEWTDRVPEVTPLGMETSPYPDRIVAKPGFEKELAKRTLTNLYNQRPAWLAQAHDKLDAAVAAAYGWGDYTAVMADEEILRRLLALNAARGGAG